MPTQCSNDITIDLISIIDSHVKVKALCVGGVCLGLNQCAFKNRTDC